MRLLWGDTFGATLILGYPNDAAYTSYPIRITPENIMEYAEVMHPIGTSPHAPAFRWKLFFDDMNDAPGS
jgi:hypothetical protein